MPKAIPQFIGARVRRREDPNLITGRGTFVADVELPSPVTMAFVRSPYAHAVVRSIDTSAAVAMDGVLTVLTAHDIDPLVKRPFPVVWGADGGVFESKFEQERRPLARDRARHVGDPIAVVVAESPYVAADAVEAVVVDYEPLPVVTDPEQAVSGEAPALHEGCPRNTGFEWSLEGGSVDEAMAASEVQVEIRLQAQRLVPNAMEPRAVAATYSDGAGYTLWSTTQIPHQLRDFVAEILDVEPDRMRVVAPEVGGGFGAKCNVYGEEVLAAALARHLRRSVRWTATRSEDYLTTSHGRDQRAVVRVGASGDGRILAVDAELTMDCGAYYSRVTPIIPPLTGVMMSGVYDIPNLRVRARGVFTNKVWSEPYRGAGRPEAAYFLERAVDRLAAELDLEPAEVRRRNFIPPESFPYVTRTGLTYDSGEYARALDALLSHVDYPELRAEQKRRRESPRAGRLLGVGLSCYVEICGFGPWEHGTVSVGADGRVTVLSGTSPHGQGHATSWAQITADTLQVPMESVDVVFGDTAVVPKGIGTMGSRSAAVGGMAVLETSEAVRDGACEVAAHLLEAAPLDLRLDNGRFHVAGFPKRSVGWREVAAFAHSPDLPAELEGKLDTAREYRPKGETYPFGAHAAVVEIDPETGEIAILRFVTVDDCGRVLNPLLVEGQVHGGIAQGLGQALWERAVYDEQGNLLTANLMEYAVPRADMLPRYETHRTETPTPLNALGVKGVGEAATIGSTPALVNAVVDALAPFGVTHVDTPLTPERIWALIR